MKYFVVADVHGFYDKMIKALKDAGFDRDNPEHIFVSLGDLFDRGDQAVKCLEFVMSLNPARRILIRGNHEDRPSNRSNIHTYTISNEVMSGTFMYETGYPHILYTIDSLSCSVWHCIPVIQQQYSK